MNSSRNTVREGRRAWRTTARRCSSASARRTDSSEPGAAQNPTNGCPFSSTTAPLPFAQRMSVLWSRKPSRITALASARAVTSSASSCSLAHRVTMSQNLYDSTWCRAGIWSWLGAANCLPGCGGPAFFVLYRGREAFGVSYDFVEHLHRRFLLAETEQQGSVAIAGLQADEHRNQLAKHCQRSIGLSARFQHPGFEQPCFEGPHFGRMSLQPIERRTSFPPVLSFDRRTRQPKENGSVRRIRALEAAFIQPDGIAVHLVAHALRSQGDLVVDA